MPWHHALCSEIARQCVEKLRTPCRGEGPHDDTWCKRHCVMPYLANRHSYATSCQGTARRHCIVLIDPTTPRRAEGLHNDILYRGTTWCHVLPGVSFRVRDRVRIQLFQYPGMADPWSGRPPEWRTQIPFQGYHFFKNKTSCIFIMCHYNAVHLFLVSGINLLL